MIEATPPASVSAPTVLRGRVRYVRCKPGKGLVVLYGMGQRNTENHDLVCLTLAEAEGRPVDGHAVRILLNQLELAGRNGAGMVAPEGITVRRLPDDPGLPALKAAWIPSPGDDLCRALEAMLARTTGTEQTVVGARAVPRRYKPGSRCVIEYRLRLSDGVDGNGNEPRQMTVYGKLFGKPAEADEVDSALRRLAPLWDDKGSWSGCSPRPLGVLGTLGMSFTEATQGVGRARSGLTVLRPTMIRTSAGRRAAPTIPATELRLAAGALARLHGGRLGVDGLPMRTGRYEGERARKRGALLASFVPELSSTVESLSRRTAIALTELNGANVRPCHGSFKRSQLLFCEDGRIGVFDWDSFCAADPALDLGCFLAHLRPTSLWYERAGVRHWFDGAAACWLDAYRDEMHERGVEPRLVAAIIRRAAVYESAVLLKMATRRLRRLNSPRPGELRAMYAEADRCLNRAGLEHQR